LHAFSHHYCKFPFSFSPFPILFCFFNFLFFFFLFFFPTFVAIMNTMRQAWTWISRLGHCRGFGIQSPNDYRFVRYVINEHAPYYAYKELGKNEPRTRQKLGKLYFRLANELQPAVIVDQVGMGKWLKAGCRKAEVVEDADTFDLAVVPIQTEFLQLFRKCTDHSVVVFENIWQQQPLWHCIENDPHTVITFDLYYCGIVFFDKKRAKQNYIVNF